TTCRFPQGSVIGECRHIAAVIAVEHLLIDLDIPEPEIVQLSAKACAEAATRPDDGSKVFEGSSDEILIGASSHRQHAAVGDGECPGGQHRPAAPEHRACDSEGTADVAADKFQMRGVDVAAERHVAADDAIHAGPVEDGS